MDTLEEIFAANRAGGRISFAAKLAAGVTRRARLYEEGALRLRCPGPRRRELEAMIVNTAGGMAGGDRFAIDLTVEPGAHLIVTTAAAEKVYRTLGADASIAARIEVGAGGALAWLPQETILFDRARLERTIEVDLAADAEFLMVHAETTRLEGDLAGKLAQAAVARGGIAVASVLAAPADEAIAAAVREASRQCRGEVGISAWNGFAVMRLVAGDGATLRHDLACVLPPLRGGRRLPHWLD